MKNRKPTPAERRAHTEDMARLFPEVAPRHLDPKWRAHHPTPEELWRAEQAFDRRNQACEWDGTEDASAPETDNTVAW